MALSFPAFCTPITEQEALERLGQEDSKFKANLRIQAVFKNTQKQTKAQLTCSNLKFESIKLKQPFVVKIQNSV